MTNRTRILHITEALGGGLQTAVVSYIAGTPEHSHAVLARVRVGVSTLDLPEGTAMHTVAGGLSQFLRKAREAATGGGIDIVHLHSSYAGLLRLTLPAKVRIVYSPHCYSMERLDQPQAARALFWAVEKIAAQRRQVLVALSPRELQLGLTLRRTQRNVVVPNAAISLGRVLEAERQPGPPTLTMLGRILPQKDPQFFADVVRALGPGRYRYLWIGDGDLRARRELEALGVDVTGWVTPQRVRSLLRASDLYIHTAAWEGSPLSTIEAISVGCPVLSRSISSMESLGYALGGEDPAALARSVRRFFNDPEFAADVYAKSAAVATNATMETMAAQLNMAYTLEPQ